MPSALSLPAGVLLPEHQTPRIFCPEHHVCAQHTHSEHSLHTMLPKSPPPRSQQPPSLDLNSLFKLVGLSKRAFKISRNNANPQQSNQPYIISQATPPPPDGSFLRPEARRALTGAGKVKPVQGGHASHPGSVGSLPVPRTCVCGHAHKLV